MTVRQVAAALCAASALTACASCTAPAAAPGTSGIESSQINATTSDGSCTETVGLFDAVSGRIHAGPFTPNGGWWRVPGGSKLWVGSDRPGPNDGALLQAVPVDGLPGEAQDQVRGPSDASVADLELFYPGEFSLPRSGTWHLTVTIGPDSGCFVISGLP